MKSLFKTSAAVLGAAVLTCPWVHAEEQFPFSDGLQQLAKLGMPDMKGATWVKLDDKDGGHSEMQRAGMLQRTNVQLKGNAWKLATDPPSYLGMGGTEPFQLESAKESGSEADAGPSLRDKIRAYAEKNAPPDQKPAPKVEYGSLAERDAASIVKGIQSPEYANQINDRMRWGGDDGVLAGCLLFAAQLAVAGDEKSANQIAAAIFGVVEDDIAVINMAINQLAASEYNRITQRFYEHNDWKTYLEELKAILRKYPRGWTNHGAVDILAARVAKRNPMTAPESIEDIKINPQARELIAKLLEKPEAPNDSDAIKRLAVEYGLNPDKLTAAQEQGLRRALEMGYGPGDSSGGCWLLEKPEADPKAPVIEQIKALGMDALPALAAMTEDETLTYHPHSSGQDHFDFMGDSNQSVQQIYDSMSRPSSRGEIICGLLISIVAVDAPSYRSPTIDPTTLREMTLDLYREHKDSSPTTLALYYFNRGQEEQQSQAATFLTASNDPAALKLFEDAVLKHQDPLSMLPHVETYLRERKGEAKAFAQAFIKKLKDMNYSDDALDNSNYGYQIRSVGGVDKYCNRLSLIVGDVSLDKIISQALKEKPHTDEDGEEFSPIMALASSIESLGLVESMSIFAKYADQATPEQWEEIVVLLLNRAQNEAMERERAKYQEGEDGEEEPDPSTAEPAPTPEALSPEAIAIWGKLRSKDTAISPKDSEIAYMRMLGCDTIGDVTTILIDIASGSNGLNDIYSVSMLYSDSGEVLKLSNKRVDAILKGEQPDAWPDLKSVSEERSKEITDKLAQLPAGEILAYANSLSMDERLVVMEYARVNYRDEDAAKNILELNRTITQLKPVMRGHHDPEAIKAFDIQLNQQINEEFMLKITDQLLKDTKKYSPSMLVINRGMLGMGSTVQALTPALEDWDPDEDYSLEHLSMVFGQEEDIESLVMINMGRHALFRTLKEGKPEWIDIKIFRRGGEAPDLKQALEDPYAFMRPITITLLTRDKAESDEDDN